MRLRFSALLHILNAQAMCCGFEFGYQPIQNWGKVFTNHINLILQKWEICALGMIFLGGKN